MPEAAASRVVAASEGTSPVDFKNRLYTGRVRNSLPSAHSTMIIILCSVRCISRGQAPLGDTHHFFLYERSILTGAVAADIGPGKDKLTGITSREDRGNQFSLQIIPSPHAPLCCCRQICGHHRWEHCIVLHGKDGSLLEAFHFVSAQPRRSDNHFLAASDKPGNIKISTGQIGCCIKQLLNLPPQKKKGWVVRVQFSFMIRQQGLFKSFQ